MNLDLESIDHALTTTRSVRKRLDLGRPVEPEIIERCIDIAVQAPIASNQPTYHFLVVTDPGKRAAVASWYLRSFDVYAQSAPDREYVFVDKAELVRSSARYLADHMHEVPVLVIPCVDGRVDGAPVARVASVYGSILPAAWSFMIALRSRGLGSAWTTLHLVHEKEVAELLSIPDGVTQTALIPVAYFKGEDFKPAKRLPASERTYWNGWSERRAS